METGRRVLLHVGTPKTGTSYLQDVLFHNREALAEQDVYYFADRFDAHFLAALDLMDLPWGGIEEEATGAWNALAEKVRAVEHGTVIISHEILASASWQQAKHALESLGDSEIHIMLSARDLARQIPAEWQENIKHRSVVSYAEFLDEVRDPAREGRIGSWFWGVQELPDILDRWTQGIPPERVHLITVPPPGSDSALLWQRFSQAFWLDDLEIDLAEIDRGNPSLGVPEAALLREVNLAVVPVIEPADYRPFVREFLAHRTLAKRRGSARLALSPSILPWVDALSRSWVDALSGRGYDVVGGLDELLVPGDLAGKPFVDPDTIDSREVLDAGVATIDALLQEAIRLRSSEARLEDEVTTLRADLAHTQSLVPKERARNGLERRWWGRAILRVYRVFRR
ncbi:hypothetical protein FB381_0057 [Nocardioides albertanoniae]|uniref:Sulfotransferase family protein n=1 Tax=Nocardioides albertanoniae TaxID=1175486 RepID=A0A543A0U0_9ACTN|nr:hypothetical protein FB381_0057 [Nocardioides albertanoniae]